MSKKERAKKAAVATWREFFRRLGDRGGFGGFDPNVVANWTIYQCRMMTCDEKELRGRTLTADNADDQKALLETVRKIQKQKAAMALATFSGTALGGATDGK